MRPLVAIATVVTMVALIGTFSFAYSCTTGTVSVVCVSDDGDTIATAEATVATTDRHYNEALTHVRTTLRAGFTIGKAVARTAALVAVIVAKTAVHLVR